jgi:GDPmannose 4,6-dehydratase
MNLTLTWIGEGIDEKGFINGHNLISVNEKYFRPSEVDYLKGDSSKLRKLGWKPLFSFEELVSEMMNSDVKSS